MPHDGFRRCFPCTPRRRAELDRRRWQPNRSTGHHSGSSTDATHNSLARAVREKAPRTWHLRGVTYLLRSDISGGTSLRSGCDETHIGSDVRVTYDATHTFMKSRVASNSPYRSAAGRPLRRPMTQGSGSLKFYFHHCGIKRSVSPSCDWNSGVDGPMPLDDKQSKVTERPVPHSRVRHPSLSTLKRVWRGHPQECSNVQRSSTLLIKSRLGLRHVLCVAKGVS